MDIHNISVMFYCNTHYGYHICFTMKTFKNQDVALIHHATHLFFSGKNLMIKKSKYVQKAPL